MQSPSIETQVMTANDFVSNKFRKVLSVELCNPHEVLLPLGHFQK